MKDAADSLMAIFAMKRSATIRGNVIEPVFVRECVVCREPHRSNEVPFQCETGDGL